MTRLQWWWEWFSQISFTSRVLSPFLLVSGSGSTAMLDKGGEGCRSSVDAKVSYRDRDGGTNKRRRQQITHASERSPSRS